MACSLVAKNTVSDCLGILPYHGGSSAGSSLLSLANGQPEPEQSYQVESSSGYTLRVRVPGSWIDDVDVDKEMETVSDLDGSAASDDMDRATTPEIEETSLATDEQESPSPIILTTRTITVTPNDNSSGTLVCSSSCCSTESASVSPTTDSEGTGIGYTKPQSIRSLDSELDNHMCDRSISVELEAPEVEPEFRPHVERERERWPRASSLDIRAGDGVNSVIDKQRVRQAPLEVDGKVLSQQYLRDRPATSPSSRVTNPIPIPDTFSTARSIYSRQEIARTGLGQGQGPEGAISIWQTSYRPPPPLRPRIPPESVRVRIWAVAVDSVDGRLAGSIGGGGGGSSAKPEETVDGDEDGGDGDGESGRMGESDVGIEGIREGPLPGISKNPFMALSRTLGVHLGKRKKEGSRSQENLRKNKQMGANAFDRDSNASDPPLDLKPKGKIKLEPRPPTTGSIFKEAAPYIPGRSFVGQIEEVGVYVDQRDRDKPSGLRRGEWVIGLVDVRKSGALAEFIVVDWRRVHRVPKECIAFPSVDQVTRRSSPSISSTHEQSTEEASDNGQSEGKEDWRTLTLEELALLPLCGIPAYRAVSTFLEAFVDDHEITDYTEELSDSKDEMDTSSHDDTPTQSRPYPLIRPQRRRALILRGTDGAGALAAQMLIRLGWRVSVHAPFSRVPENATQELADAYMCSVEEQARSWGADEVIFDDAEAERTWDEGWRTREAIVRVMETIRVDGDMFDAVLDTVGGKEIREASERLLSLNTGVGQFATLVGDNPELAIPTIDDGGKEGCTCVSPAQEGEPVFEMLGPILSLAIKACVRPVVEDPSGETFGRKTRVVAFDRAFVKNRNAWWLANGGTLVIRLVA